VEAVLKRVSYCPVGL